jgi:hypothetical protein
MREGLSVSFFTLALATAYCATPRLAAEVVLTLARYWPHAKRTFVYGVSYFGIPKTLWQNCHVGANE